MTAQPRRYMAISAILVLGKPGSLLTGRLGHPYNSVAGSGSAAGSVHPHKRPGTPGQDWFRDRWCLERTIAR